MEPQSEPSTVKKLFIGIDNGSTGSVACISADGILQSFLQIPTRVARNYTKAAQAIHRLNYREFMIYLSFLNLNNWDRTVVALERPMINPVRFKQSVAAARFFEATLIALEQHNLPIELVDSKAWQKALLQEGLKGPELKAAAVQKARELFPTMSEQINHKTADGILIAEWARRVNL